MAPLTKEQLGLAVRRRNGAHLRLRPRHKDDDEIVPATLASPASPTGVASPASPASPTSLSSVLPILPTTSILPSLPSLTSSTSISTASLTTLPVLPTPDSASNRNGAQVSDVPLLVSETALPPPPPPSTTTTTAISTAPTSVVTSYIPILTTVTTSSPSLTSLISSTPLGSASTCLTTSSISTTAAVAAAASTVGLTATPALSISSTLSVIASTTSAAKKHKATASATDDDNSTSGVITGGTNEKGNSGSVDDDGDDYKHDSPKEKPLSPAAEHALISVGSIGAFITVCFLAWLVWRAMGRRKQRKMPHQGVDPSPTAPGIGGLPRRLYATVANRVPFLQRRQRPWHTLDGANEAGIPIDSRSLGRAGSLKSLNSLHSLNHPQLPEMYDKGFGASPAVQYDSSLGLSLPPHLLLQLQQQQQQQLQQQYTYRSVSSNSGSSVLTHQPSASFSSTSTAYANANMPVAELAGSEGPPLPSLPAASETVSTLSSMSGVASTISDLVADGDSATGSDTLRSRMPDSFYNQSQLARQPSDAYDPARREVNRVSELSSLSSGFGDGEIMMPLPQLPGASLGLTADAETFTIPPPAVPTPAANGPGHFSWMRSSRRLTSNTRRETVFTEASEDQPPRFRTVTSWVHQQTGRVRRGQQGQKGSEPSSTAETAPGVAHPLPAEQRLTMMADDGQEPRRPETVPTLMTGTSP